MIEVEVKPARAYRWGLFSQIASSLTNFGLSLFAARALGPVGLGEVFIGFSFYLVALGFQRGLINDPLVVASAESDVSERGRATRAGLTMTLLLGISAAVAMVVAGAITSGNIGAGLSLFAPWLVVAMVHDFWRSVLFRDGRGRAAATNDIAWLVSMLLLAVVASTADATWIVVAVWGAGALVGAVAGFVQVKALPMAPGTAFRWWRKHSWGMARWLAIESVVYTSGSYLVIMILAVVLGSAALGGLRAVQSLFAPLSVLGPALALPGLPALVRANARDRSAGVRLALSLTGAAFAMTGLYLAVATGLGGDLLSAVFGEPFGRFEPLLVPVGVGQLAVALSVGSTLLLKARSRGSSLVAGRAIGSVATLAFGALLASRGVVGAAWGMTIGAAVGAFALTAMAMAPTRRSPKLFSGSLPAPRS